jgi:hypothetical protein
MKRVVMCVALMCSLLVITACPSEKTARDTAAALQGVITTAQTQYASCAQDKTPKVCGVISRAVDGQNALVTATEAYCGWSIQNPPADPNAPCVPVKSAAAGLQTAINNANLFITEVKGIIKP